MEQTVWPIADGVSEMIRNVDSNVSYEATAALPTTLTISTNQLLPENIVWIVGVIIGITGSLVNTVVFVILVLARREYGNNVNTLILIINQSAMDLLSCVCLVATCVALLCHDFVHHGDQTVHDVLCVAVVSGTLTTVGVTSEKLGLIVITLERYFKIVHAIAHRKYYCSWMTKVGVVLPWVGGACLTLFPAIGTTRVVNGRCLRFAVWPTEGMLKAYGVVKFLFCYAVPVSVFGYCYGRIFQTIRGHNKVISGHSGRGQDIAMASTSRAPTAGHIQQQETGNTGAKLSMRELNVLQTMIAVIICFLICWSVVDINNFLESTGVAALPHDIYHLFLILGLINLSLNPIIYAARYDVFKRYVKQKLSKNHVTPANVNER